MSIFDELICNKKCSNQLSIKQVISWLRCCLVHFFTCARHVCCSQLGGICRKRHVSSTHFLVCPKEFHITFRRLRWIRQTVLNKICAASYVILNARIVVYVLPIKRKQYRYMYTFPCLHRNCHSGIEKGQNRKCLGCVQHELHRNTVHGKFPLVESPLSYSELSSIDSDWWKRMQVITVHLINRIKTSTSLGQVKVNMARLHLGARFGLRTYKMPDPCILS